MLNRLNALKEQHQRNRETFDYKLGYAVLELTENILKRMDEKKINRAELAKRLGVSKSAVTRMLDGNTNFTLKRLLSVALALECEKIDVSFPPSGFTTPPVFVSQKGYTRDDQDYKGDPYEHITPVTVEGAAEKVA